jgi:small subunit ribosomal protein S9
MASKKKADAAAPKKAKAKPGDAAQEQAAAETPAEQTSEQGPSQEAPVADAAPQEEAASQQQAEPPAEVGQPAAAEPSAAEEQGAAQDQPQPEQPQPVAASAGPEHAVAAEAPATAESGEERAGADEEQAAEQAGEPPRARPSVPGAHLEVDIVPEGVDPLGRGEQEYEDPYALEEEYLAPPEAEEQEEEREEILSQPIASAAIDLAAGARYRATGKRKSAIARVTLRPGSGTYLINGRSLEEHFPRSTLQRNIRQPLEMVGYEERMDVVARLHGGGISAQAGALRHGVSRALLEADPNLRSELKRRGFLTRDSRAKERKKAGLKKARKRPQFSKR